MASYSIREELDALVVTIVEPDALNDFRSNAFRDSFYDAIMAHNQKAVALDLGQVDFLSSSGVAILVGLKRRVEAREGNLVVFALQPVVKELLRITRLAQYFTYADDEAEALHRLRLLPTV